MNKICQGTNEPRLKQCEINGSGVEQTVARGFGKERVFEGSEVIRKGLRMLGLGLSLEKWTLYRLTGRRKRSVGDLEVERCFVHRTRGDYDLFKTKMICSAQSGHCGYTRSPHQSLTLPD